MARQIRVDDEVHYHTLKAKALLEIATGQVVRLGDAMAFLLVLSHR